MELKGRGGPGRGQGRKAKDGAERLRHFTVNLTEGQITKIKGLGGSLWLRQKLDEDCAPVSQGWVMPELLGINPRFTEQLQGILDSPVRGVSNGN